MNYEAWRISYQSSEQAARAAFGELQKLAAERDKMKAQYSELHSATKSLLADYYVALDNVAGDWDQDELLDAHQFAGHVDGILKQTPAQALAEVQAQAVNDFCREIGLFDSAYDDQEYIEVSRSALREHADALRAQAKEAA